MKVNMGCGDSPTPGWVNIDNSPTVRLARTPLRFLLRGKSRFVDEIRRGGVRYGTALHTGLPDAAVDILYSSHMLEHLTREEARHFLDEARRVLKPGGILRLAVPDLKLQVEDYLRRGDADRFMDQLLVIEERPKTLAARARFLFLTGFRQHLWMYDQASLTRLLSARGFTDIAALPAGETRIAEPGQLNLREREEESLYIEAVRPAAAPGGRRHEEPANEAAPPEPAAAGAGSR